MDHQEPHFLIVGAGISGLLLAHALRKKGIKNTIFETETSAKHSRPREWGMSIHWATSLLEKILSGPVDENGQKMTVDPNIDRTDSLVIPTFNVETGELLKDLLLGKVYRVSRRRFRAWLAEDVDIQYAKCFRRYELSDDGTSVTAYFEDGSSLSGTVLVGTDGAHSAIRSTLFGHDKSERSTLPYSAVNLHVHYPDPAFARSVREYNSLFSMGVHPAGIWVWISIQDVSDPNDASTWSFQVQATWKSRPGEDVTSLSALKHRTSTFAEPFRSVFSNIPDETRVYENKMNYWVPQRWGSAKGRLALLGDAVHPMTFQRGQGLNHCIADVAALVDAINPDASNVEEAIDKYQDEMVPRAGDEVKLSVKNTTMLHDWDMFMQSPVMAKGVVRGVKPT